jgi:aldehyde dehydrogenase (NAD+)
MAAKPQIPSLTPAEAFFAESPLNVFIGGQWRPTKRKKTFETVDPGSGTVLARVYSSETEDVHDAVEAAHQAFERSGWARMAPNERAVCLHRLADLVEKHSQTLAQIESFDVGKPLAQARSDIASFPATMRYYSDLAQQIQYREPLAVSKHEARTVRHPWGVCGFILPWNFPFLLAGWNISPALAAGNTVVIKPAEDTPLSTLYLMRLVKEAGIPDGVVNVVTGFGEPTGAALAHHAGLARMGFTGSPEVGRLIAQACGRNLVPVKLELGGKGAAVVFEDVDVERTAEVLVKALTLNAGQVCCTATRWVIQASIYDRFVSFAIDRLKKVKIGYGIDPLTEMGPIINRKQVDRILGYIRKGRKEGAELLLEGGETEVPGKKRGFYVKPAVLAGPPDNIAAREEIFGPVAYLLKFGTEAEAIELANRTAYGLANSVWTQDLERANRVAEAMVAGNSWINAHNVFAHGVPYAGVKVSGMGGGVLGPHTLFDYLRDQSVVRPLG